MSPDEVLDLSLWQFNAIVEGYQDRLHDQYSMAVMTGYWSAYYANTKHPKAPKKVLDKKNTKRVELKTEDLNLIAARDFAFRECEILGNEQESTI